MHLLWSRCLALLLTLTICSTTLSQDIPGAEHIVMSKKTPTLSVKSVDMLTDGTPMGAHLNGSTKVQVTVYYGWWPGYASWDDKPMMHLTFTKSEWSKMPRVAHWHLSLCDGSQGCEFHIENAEATAERLFDKNALKLIRGKKLLQVRRVSNLELTDLSFGNDCGLHYSATAYVQRATYLTKQVAMNKGFSLHC
jgi:hypothetical protein